LYFADNDKEFFEAITGLFSNTKEQDFLHRMQDTDEFNVMRANVKNDDLKKVADGMQIQEFPFAACYFEGDVSDVVAGPADEDTAARILEHTKILDEPEPVPEPIPEPEPQPEPAQPVVVPQPNPEPRPEPEQPRRDPVAIRDLNRPIEIDDEYLHYGETEHQYDYIDPINQFIAPGNAVFVEPEIIVGGHAPARRSRGPIILEVEDHHRAAPIEIDVIPSGRPQVFVEPSVIVEPAVFVDSKPRTSRPTTVKASPSLGLPLKFGSAKNSTKPAVTASKPTTTSKPTPTKSTTTQKTTSKSAPVPTSTTSTRKSTAPTTT